MSSRPNFVATVSLLTAASTWGLLWYPYRVIEQAGINGVVSSMATYAIAFLLGLVVLRRAMHELRLSWWLPLIALAAGGTNLGYVLAVLNGEVMRVLLLFYLSPLWTVLLSRLMLHERLRPTGVGVIGLSLSGAVVMLWHPEMGMPWPRDGAEWIGLGAGFMFALNNVLIRRTGELSIELKCMVSFAGVVVCSGLVLPWAPQLPAAAAFSSSWWLLLLVGAILLAVNVTVQYGLTRVNANRASVILLFELIIAAIASWLLAGENMELREWIGGTLIIVASLFSGHLSDEGEVERSRIVWK